MAVERIALPPFNVEHGKVTEVSDLGIIFCTSQAFREDARNLHSLPICTALISPLRASLWSVFGWIFSIAAASSLSNRGSNSVAAWVIMPSLGTSEIANHNSPSAACRK